MPEAYVEIHPDDARDAGIHNGDLVKISTRRGSIDVRAWIGGRGSPPRGLLFIPFFDENKLVNLVTLEDYDFFSKQTDYKKCAASITRVTS
jgi:nitrate reductase NapA